RLLTLCCIALQPQQPATVFPYTPLFRSELSGSDYRPSPKPGLPAGGSYRPVHEQRLRLHDNRHAANGLQDEHHLRRIQPMLPLDNGWRAELHAGRRSAGLSVSKMQSMPLGMRPVKLTGRILLLCRMRFVAPLLIMKLQVEGVWKDRGTGTGCNQWRSPMSTSAAYVVNPLARRTRRVLLIACLLTAPVVAWRGTDVAAAVARDRDAAAAYQRGVV